MIPIRRAIMFTMVCGVLPAVNTLANVNLQTHNTVKSYQVCDINREYATIHTQC